MCQVLQQAHNQSRCYTHLRELRLKRGYFTQEHFSASVCEVCYLRYKVTKFIVQEVTEYVSSGTYLARFLLCSNLRAKILSC